MAFDKMIVKKLLKKFDDVPFVVKFPDGEEFKVGEGEPQAIIRANGGIDMGAVMKSPSLALGEAYMDKTLELEKGDLFEILNMVLAIRNKKSQPIMILAMNSLNYGWMKP